MYGQMVQRRNLPPRVQPSNVCHYMLSPDPPKGQTEGTDRDTVLVLRYPDSPLCITPDVQEYAYYVFDDLKHERNQHSEDAVRQECAGWQEVALVDSYPASLKMEARMLVSSDRLRLLSSHFERQFSRVPPIRDVNNQNKSVFGDTREALHVVMACGWDERAMRLLMEGIHAEDPTPAEIWNRLPPSLNNLHTEFELALMLDYYGFHDELREAIAPLTLTLGERRPVDLGWPHSLRKYATIACVFKDVDLVNKVFITLVHESNSPFDPYNLPISVNFLDVVEHTRHRLLAELIRALRYVRVQARLVSLTLFCTKACVKHFLKVLEEYENSYPEMSISSFNGKSLSLLRSYMSMRRLIDEEARCQGRGKRCTLYRNLESVRDKCENIIYKASENAVAAIVERGSRVDTVEG
ncbi:unnamed protein product [Clonostachys rosea]|uniref:BTB domain-containing protein n=1 Tax=Bionectria ochroleuca TaxID=29856 RepID=A0ABY6UAJ7_BIOOC|nr:unnamed protein product [Clonostachys rosea]